MMKTKFAVLWIAAAGIAAAQGTDSPGVTVDLNGATLLHRPPVSYPEPVRARNVKGSVTAEVLLDAAGNVSDARVLSGPEELRRAVLQSVLGWHFSQSMAGMRRLVTISFDPAIGALAPVPPRTAVAKGDANSATPRTIQSIEVLGLTDALRAEVLARFPLHVGDLLTPDAMDRAAKAIREFDEHMGITTIHAGSGLAGIRIGTTDARLAMRTEPRAEVPGRINVGGDRQQAALIEQARPVYPPEAKEARIQGTVRLAAVVGRDGNVQQLDVVSGHPLLAPAAIDAVKHWVYRPTLLNGSPVEVSTQIDINFTLSQ